jgi:murein DD-endopeptidase MepM/ murein hydrolase activator NlpD
MTDKTPGSGWYRWLAALSVGGWALRIFHKPTPLIAILGPALGGAFLIPNPWVGAILWFAVFQNFRYAAFALLGIVIAEGISRTFNLRETSPIDGSLKANAVLTAIAAAWLTGPAGVGVETQILVVVVSTVAATILTAAVTRALANLNLPSLVIGYCLVATMLFAIFPDWTRAAIASMEWWPVPTDVMGWTITFFRTLGALLFSPTLEFGLIVAAAVLLWSRTAFVAGVVGWIAGIVVAIAVSGAGGIYYWMPTAYNFFLSGMALGAVFFLSGRASMLLAAMGGASASLLAVGLQHLFPSTALGNLPVASALVVWIAIYALALNDSQTIPQRNQTSELPAEKAWWRAAYWQRRLGRQGPFLVVPISVTTKISQGFDGLLSHVGPWRYALDFQQPDMPGQPRRRDADGAATWSPPVTAPASGVIERIRGDIVDNPLGICNYAENWGNYVIIRLDQGGWVLLAHLRQGSIAVRPGERVEIGAYLGAVGNSGRTPVPHLHLQVQNSPEPGAASAPFRLANFLSAIDAESPLLRWHAVTLPDQGTIVAPAPPNPPAQRILSSIAPGSAVWAVESDGVIPGPLRKACAEISMRITISLDVAGRHLFRGTAGNGLASHLDADAWRVLELQDGASPFLTLLALAVPSIPYAATGGMAWEDLAPVIPFGRARWLGLALSPYLAEPFARVRCHCISAPGLDSLAERPLVIETHLETAWEWLPTKLICEFDRLRGPVRLEAFFLGGSLTYSLISFEPGLPFPDYLG